MTNSIAVCALAYLLGSIPFGYLLVRMFRGEDIRSLGSGNIGATNVARSGARGLGLLTLLLDALKGFVSVAGAVLLTRRYQDMDLPAVSLWLPAMAAVCVVLGHVFPVWLRFKGGKGVATGVGAFLALAPKAVLVVVLLFLIVLVAFRYVSLASIVAAAAFPAIAFFLYRRSISSAVLVAMAGVSALIVLKHKDNIQRLLAGNENRFQPGKG